MSVKSQQESAERRKLYRCGLTIESFPTSYYIFSALKYVKLAIEEYEYSFMRCSSSMSTKWTTWCYLKIFLYVYCDKHAPYLNTIDSKNSLKQCWTMIMCAPMHLAVTSREVVRTCKYTTYVNIPILKHRFGPHGNVFTRGTCRHMLKWRYYFSILLVHSGC